MKKVFERWSFAGLDPRIIENMVDRSAKRLSVKTKGNGGQLNAVPPTKNDWIFVIEGKR